MVLEYLKLFVTFAKIGMFTIGGGYAMIPLIEREIVNKQWMNKEEFMEMFALTQSLPGKGEVHLGIGALQGKGGLAARAGAVHRAVGAVAQIGGSGGVGLRGQRDGRGIVAGSLNG